MEANKTVDKMLFLTEAQVIELVERGRQEGVRKVVELIETHSSLHQIVEDGYIILKVSILLDDWHDKLKEWGEE